MDTHADLHHAAVVDPLGRSLADHTFPTTSAGYADLARWCAQFGRVLSVGIEGTSSYGAALTRQLREGGMRVVGKGHKVVLVPLPPAVARSVDRARAGRIDGPLLLNTQGRRLDRHAATRRLHHLADHAGIRVARMHPHMLRHTYVTTMLDAGVDLRDVQIAARHADPRTTMRYDRARTTLDRHPNYILAAYMASGT